MTMPFAASPAVAHSSPCAFAGGGVLIVTTPLECSFSCDEAGTTIVRLRASSAVLTASCGGSFAECNVVSPAGAAALCEDTAGPNLFKQDVGTCRIEPIGFVAVVNEALCAGIAP